MRTKPRSTDPTIDPEIADLKHNIRSTDRLPNAVYGMLAGLVFWLVLASWSFAGAGYVDVALAVVTGFFLIVMGIPLALWLVWRASPDPDAKPEKPETFADCDFSKVRDLARQPHRRERRCRDHPADRRGCSRHDGVRDRVSYRRAACRGVSSAIDKFLSIIRELISKENARVGRFTFGPFVTS